MRRPTTRPIPGGTRLQLRLLLMLALCSERVLYTFEAREAIAKGLGLAVAVERGVINEHWIEQTWIALVIDIDGRHNLPSLIQRIKQRSAAHAWAGAGPWLRRCGLKEGALWRPGFRVASLCAPDGGQRTGHGRGCPAGDKEN